MLEKEYFEGCFFFENLDYVFVAYCALQYTAIAFHKCSPSTYKKLQFSLLCKESRCNSGLGFVSSPYRPPDEWSKKLFPPNTNGGIIHPDSGSKMHYFCRKNYRGLLRQQSRGFSRAKKSIKIFSSVQNRYAFHQCFCMPMKRTSRNYFPAIVFLLLLSPSMHAVFKPIFRIEWVVNSGNIILEPPR